MLCQCLNKLKNCFRNYYFRLAICHPGWHLSNQCWANKTATFFNQLFNYTIPYSFCIVVNMWVPNCWVGPSSLHHLPFYADFKYNMTTSIHGQSTYSNITIFTQHNYVYINYYSNTCTQGNIIQKSDKYATATNHKTFLLWINNKNKWNTIRIMTHISMNNPNAMLSILCRMSSNFTYYTLRRIWI